MSIRMCFYIRSGRADRTILVLLQEISSLVGEVRPESSEAEAITLMAVAEEEEPMQTDGPSEHAEASATSVLQVQVESSEAASQVS